MEGFVPRLRTNPRAVQKTYIVLPAYNEAAALSQLIPNIHRSLEAAKRPFEVIVINDGSSDDTTPILNSMPSRYAIRELPHAFNQGYGAALRTAFLWLAEHAKPEDAVVTLDADNTQDPAYIPRLLDKLEEGYDAVTASYTMAGGHSSGVPWKRRVMSALLNRLFQRVVPLAGARTYTNGFRAYRLSALQVAHRRYGNTLIEETGFPGGTEFFLKIAGTGGPLAEIPFDLQYEHRGTASKIHLLHTIRRYLRLLMTGRRYTHA